MTSENTPRLQVRLQYTYMFMFRESGLMHGGGLECTGSLPAHPVTGAKETEARRQGTADRVKGYTGLDLEGCEKGY